MDPARDRPAAFTAVTAAAIAAGAVAAAWAWGGVSLSEGLRAIAFEAVFAAVPGVAALVALGYRAPSILTLVAVGWAVGCAFEVGAFTATAATGTRGLLAFYPVAIVLPALGAILRRRRRSAGDPRSATEGAPGAPDAKRGTGVTLALGFGLALAVAYMAVGAFPVLPRPSSVTSVSYAPDLVLDTAYTAEAVHHWPLTRPWVSGLPIDYHWLVFAHAAGMVEVFGEDPAWVFFRLLPVMLLCAAFLLTFAVGWRLSGSRRIGAGGAVMLFLLGELDLLVKFPIPFWGTFRDNLWQSPTFLFGLVLFLAALMLVWELMDPSRRANRWLWLAAAPVAFAGAGAKSPVLPILVGGVCLYAFWRSVALRRLDRPAAGIAVALVALFGLAWYVFFRGTGGDYLQLAPFGSLMETPFWRHVVAPAHLPALLMGVAWITAGAALVAPVLGAAAIAWRRLAPPQVFLLSLFAVSFALFNVVHIPGFSQLYILHYGYAAGVVLSAWGIAIEWGRLAPARRLRLLLLGMVVVGVLIVVAVVVDVYRAGGTFADEWNAAYARFALTAGAVVSAAAVLGRRARLGRAAAALAGLLIVIGVSALQPAVELYPGVVALLHGRPAYAVDGPHSQGITRDLYAGLAWISQHTPASAVLATGVYYLDPATDDARYMYVSGFAQRRVFLESWDNTPQANLLYNEGKPNTQPFPDRYALNERLFKDADPAAAHILHDRYGVDFVVLDLVHRPSHGRLRPLGRLVFSNAAVEVYELG